MIKRILFLFIIFSAPYTIIAEGLLCYPPSLHGFHPLYEETRIVSPLIEEHPVVFEVTSSLFKDTAIIDFEKRQITFIQYDTFSGLPIWQFHYPELDEYFKSMRRFSISALGLESQKKGEEEDKKQKGPPKLELAMPVHYPAWARRVLGKDPPKLSIKGFQSLTLKYNKRKTETGKIDTDEEKPTGGFAFDYDNMFTIRGSIGRLINIEIKTGKDKQGENLGIKDQMKKLKIEYKADPDSADQLEDEIIQEVVAGYTNFQMPGQGLAGYSGSHEGLFGVKIRSQWGPLSLTTVLSRENAETQKKTLDPSGKKAGQSKIENKNYARNAYFFLDTMYISKYIGKRESVPTVEKLYVFQLETHIQQGFNEKDYVYAAYGDDLNIARMFRRLKEYKDYEVDPRNGYIRFLGGSVPNRDQVIAIFMVLSDNTMYGDTTPVALEGNKFGYTELWLLKDRDTEIDNPGEILMWRNVYKLPSDARPDEFKIEVKRNIEENVIKHYNDILFSHILGLTDKDGNPDLGNEKIYDFAQQYLIIPPFIDTLPENDSIVYSNQPFANQNLGKDGKNVANFQNNIYIKDSIDIATSNFLIVTTGSSRQDFFQIGWGIIPGSETLTTKKGKKLAKDVDYIIDYEFGSVTLISDRAKNASAIEVDYQQESLFMFESKRFLGAYGKLDLPNIGRESYWATSIMGQFTSSRDKIPRVGHEPFNRFLFDTNLRLDFEPEWMTNLVNLIPGIKSTSASSATLDFEVAYSYLKPDKENKGEAYIDNFQSSERGYPLGESHTLWYKASSPTGWMDDTVSAMANPPAWRTYWYSPVTNSERTRREEIWELTKEDEENRNFYLTTLRLINQPLPADPTLLAQVTDASGAPKVNPWAGIMAPIPTSLQDRRKDRYLEFYVKNKRKNGVLYVDLGIVSEDLSLDGGMPNRSSDYEKPNSFQGEKNSEFDLGLDKRPDSLEYYLFPNFNSTAFSWDVLWKGDPRLGENDLIDDPSRDNWQRYNTDHKGNRKYVNGTQGDNYLTSEDINNDGFRTTERFFRVEVDFSDPNLNGFLDTAKTNSINDQNAGWFFVRIPLNVPNDTIYEKVNDPRWDNIKFLRMLWRDFGSLDNMKHIDSLEFTDIKFTGNQWQQVQTGDSGEVKIEVSVLNTIDDKGYYSRPNGIDSLDREDRVKKDYSLRLNYKGLKGDEEALIERHIPSYQKINLTSYNEIQMYIKELDARIKAPDATGTLVDMTNDLSVIGNKENFIEFVFRFGNSDSSYYEYRNANLKNHWRVGKGLQIDLKQLAELKQAYHEAHGDQLDSINLIDTLEDGGRYQIYSRTGNLPTFSEIRWMALGVVRHPNAVGMGYGEIWINGLRVKGIKPIDGWAFRANLNTQWADFMDFSANLSYDDADFRQMSEEPLLTKDAKLSAGLNAQWTVSKFLPDKWGVNVPFGTGVSATLSRPKQRPGTDILLTEGDGNADGLSKMGKDFADLIFNSNFSKDETDAEHYETNKIIKSWYTSYSKTVYADNPIVNFTADRITTNYSYSRDSTTQSEGLLPQEHKDSLERAKIGDDHIDVKSNRNHSGSIKYDLSPRKPPKWTSWTPFKKAKAKRFPRYIKNYEFKLLPNRINFDLLDGSYTRSYSYRSLEDIKTESSVERTVENLGLTHGMQFSYSPIAPLIQTDFDISVNRNFDDALAKWGLWGTGNFIKDRVFEWDPVWKKYWITFAEKSRSQNASLRVDPQFFDWLTHTADYRARYNQTPRTYQNDPNYLSAQTHSEFSFSSNFRIRSLFSSVSERTEKIKGLSNVFGTMEKGLDKVSLTSVTFSYSASSDLNNDYISTGYLASQDIWFYDFFKYQMGVKGRNFRDIITGNMNDTAAFGGVRFREKLGHDIELYKNDKRTVNQNYSIGTSMRLPKPLDVSFKPISLGWSRDYSVIPNILIMDSTITFPDLRVGASSNVLERIPVIKQNLKNLGLRSSYKLTKTTKKSCSNPGVEGSLIRSDITRRHAWEPLVSVDGLLKKKPINMNYAFRFSFDSTVSLDGDSVIDGSESKTKNFGNTWNVKYTVVGKKDRELKMFNRWTVPIKGETVMSLDVTHKKTEKSYQRPSEDPEATSSMEDAIEEDWSFLLHPKITYDFTDNVDGLLEYIFERTYTEIDETKRTNNTLALTITIYFK